MIDTLNRIMRYFRPMYYRILARLHGFKLYAYGGGEEPNPDPNPDPNPNPDPEPSWFESLPDDAKNDPEITKYKTPEEFYNGYKEKVSLIGKKGIIIPGDNATPEEREKFLNALGRPAKPEEYKVDTPPNLPESIKVTPESEQAFKNIAHKTGLTNTQANELNQWYLSAVSESVKAQEKAETEAMQKAETALRAEWKENFDSNKNKIASLIEKAGGQEAIDAMGGVDGLGNNPIVLKTLGTIANMLSEDQINNIRGPVSPSTGNETKEQALEKIKSEFNNSEGKWHKALMDENNPQHNEAVNERQRLYKIAYGGAQ